MPEYVTINGHKAVVEKGSAQNHGRKIVVWHEGGKTHSMNYARAKYLSEHPGKHLSKNQDVDHKDNNKDHDSKSNYQVLSHGKNVGKENKHRAKKKGK